MKAPRFLPLAAAVVSFVWPVAALAQAPAPAAAAPAVSNFEAVAKHLKPGGVFYTLIDIDGDLARFAGMGDKLLDLAKEQAGGALPPGLSTKGFLKALGLERLKAVGMSSTRGEGNLFHNQAFLYLPEGRSGLFNLSGGPAAPLQSPALAPADSDLVVETEVTLSALLEIAENLIKSTGDETMMQQYKGALGFQVPAPGLQMTIGDLIGKLNTRLIVAGRLLKDQSFTPPGEKFSVPGFRMVISMDQLDFLAAPLREFAKQNSGVVVETGEGFELIRPKDEVMPDKSFAFLQPLFYHDLKTKRLLLATHPDAVKEFLAGTSPIGKNPEFIKAMDDLPMEGNELSWMTPAIQESVSRVMSEMAKSAPRTSGAAEDEAFQQFMSMLEQFSPTPTHPMVAVRANLPDGILWLSKNPTSFKSIVALPAVMVTGAAFAGFSGYNKMMPAIRERAKAREEGTEKEKEVPAGDADTEAIRSNLQQIAFAAQTWFLDNAEGNDVTYDQLIKAELLFRLEPIKGEKYEGLKLKREGGTLTVKPAKGDEVSRKYGPVTD